jgi:hypothetical protein
LSDIPTTVVIAPAPVPDFIQWITGGRLNDSELLFVIGLALLLRMLWIAQRRGIDPFDMIVGDDGKLSWSKVLACTCGVTATWGFVHAELANTMTEWYFNGYMALCLGASVWMKYLAGKQGSSPPTTS